MTTKEYREAIKKNLGNIRRKADLEILYKQSEVMTKWGREDVSEEDICRSLIIMKLFNEAATVKKLSNLNAFTSAYLEL